MKILVLCLILLVLFVACKDTVQESPDCFECGSWEWEYMVTDNIRSRDSIWFPIPCEDCIVETTIHLYRRVRHRRTGKLYSWRLGRQNLQEYRTKPLDCFLRIERRSEP